jgi:hypothetical protein
MNQTFLDYYRCPDRFANFTLIGDLPKNSGFFRFGENVLCYGAASSGFSAPDGRADLRDALADVTLDGASLHLPFNPTEIVANLRRERYLRNSDDDRKSPLERVVWHAYHFLRPALPVSVRKNLQRLHLRDWERLTFPSWPVDRTVDRIFERLFALALKANAGDQIPFVWFWPEGAPSCAILTHDVETLPGRNFCSRLMDLDDTVGIKSSFEIVPEQRYAVPTSFLDSIRARGFEINVHDLNHDGHLFASPQVFLRRAEKINRYGKEFSAIGFRSGGLYRNTEWFEALDFSYDMSLPNVAHLDPQRGGCCTVLPFFIGNILELPLTTTQDYSLFHILNDYSLDLWKRQIALIVENHGLVSFIVHPDYVIEKRARETYQALLGYLAQLRAKGLLWIALPREVNEWWRERSQMQVVCDGSGWRIEGKGKERARLAFATHVEEKLAFRIEDGVEVEGDYAGRSDLSAVTSKQTIRTQ